MLWPSSTLILLHYMRQPAICLYLVVAIKVFHQETFISCIYLYLFVYNLTTTKQKKGGKGKEEDACPP